MQIVAEVQHQTNTSRLFMLQERLIDRDSFAAHPHRLKGEHNKLYVDKVRPVTI